MSNWVCVDNVECTLQDVEVCPVQSTEVSAQSGMETVATAEQLPVNASSEVPQVKGHWEYLLSLAHM